MRRRLALALVAVVALGVATAGAVAWRQRAPQGPAQPIEFWHSVHAGDNKIPCMYCHFSADRSVDAGIPPVQLCVGCHVPGSNAPTANPATAQLAFPTAQRDSLWHAEAQKLVDYWRRGEAIPWVRVHNLPDHAHFPHYVHVQVGLKCQTCHGPVERMQRVYQVAPLRMGWCIDCHRGELPLSPEEERLVQARSSFVQRMRAIAAAGGDVRGVWAAYPKQRASTDCTVCHY